MLETYEGLSNLNPAERDAFGRTKRSSCKENKVGRCELGGFVVRAMSTGVEFRLGYNHVLGGIDRVTLWEQKASLVGKIVKFKHQPSGAKEAPGLEEGRRLFQPVLASQSPHYILATTRFQDHLHAPGKPVFTVERGGATILYLFETRSPDCDAHVGGEPSR